MLGNLDHSIEHFQRALQTLPVENLSPAELKQRDDWTKDVSNVKRKRDRLLQTPTPQQVSMSENETPWKRAKAMESELRRLGIERADSSVSRFIVLPALCTWRVN